MLVSTLQYSGVTAKIKAMNKNLLTINDYKTLSKFEDLRQFYGYLIAKPAYTDIFEGNIQPLINRKELEQALFFSIYKAYRKIALFIGDMADKAMVNHILYPLKLEIVKALFRMAKKEKGQLENFHEYTEKIPFDVALFYEECKNKSWFHEPVLKNMTFQMALEQIAQQKINLAEIEMNLEIDIYLGMYRQMKKETKYFAFQDYFGREIDMLNFYKIYRFKKYFNLEPILLYTKIIPVYYTLRKEEVRLFVEAKDFTAFKKAVGKTKWNPIFDAIEQNGFEKTMAQNKMRRIKKALKDNEHSLFSIMEYFYRIQLERNNLMKIIEAINYHMDYEKVLDTLFIWERGCADD